MHILQRRFIAVFVCLAATASATLPAVWPGNAEEPHFEAKRDGPGKTVILLNNCDDSGKNGRSDNEDCVINGDEDRKQLEPIGIKAVPPRGVAVELKLVNNPETSEAAVKKVRIFGTKGKAIIGPKTKYGDCDEKTSDSYKFSPEELKELAGGELLFAEGLQFAVSARLQLWVDGKMYDELELYVAPFLLLPHTQLADLNMVVRLDPKFQKESPRYVGDFEQACSKAKVDLKILAVPHRDVWIEDQLQWGYTETPRAGMPVALHMHRNGDLQTEVQNLLAPNVGHFKAFDYPPGQNALDFGGNLEVTPPTAKYPFGRVYCGSTPGSWKKDDPDLYRRMDEGYEKFFKRQKRHPSDKIAIQEPIDLSTSWLEVGHVDELFSFVPAKNKKGFVLLWASPELALDLLNDLPAAIQQDFNYLDSENKRYRYKSDYGVKNVMGLLEGDLPPNRGSFLQMGMKTYNEKVAGKIRKNLAILQKELELTDDEIKPVPVLFHNVAFRRDSQGRNVPISDWSALALTPGVVNLSCMNGHCLIPDPHVPAFKKYLRQTFKDLQQMPIFIDDWAVYHLMSGEVHCGSNMRRQAFPSKWWN